MKKVYLLAFLFAIGCAKKIASPPDLPAVSYDTTNSIALVPDSSNVGDPSATLQFIEFQHLTKLCCFGDPGDTTFAVYEKGQGNLMLNYVAADTLLQAAGIMSLSYLGVSYRLSQNLLGKPLFKIYWLSGVDTILAKVFVAAKDSVSVFVDVATYPPGSTPATITATLNSLLYQGLDTGQYMIH